MRYLKATQDYGLHYGSPGKAALHAYSDADWGSTYDQKSISGIVVFLGDALVSWASKKQSTIALSTTEAEMIAMSEAARERLCLSNLCKSFRGDAPDLKISRTISLR